MEIPHSEPLPANERGPTCGCNARRGGEVSDKPVATKASGSVCTHYETSMDVRLPAALGEAALARWIAAAHRLGATDPGLAEALDALLARTAELAEAAPPQRAAPTRWIAFYDAAAAVVVRIAELDGPLAGTLAVSAPDALSPRDAAMDSFLHAVVRASLRETLPALEAIETARARSLRCGCDGLRLVVLVLRGRLLVLRGDVATASGTLIDGVDLARRLGARQREARMLGNLGFLYGEDDGVAYEAYTRQALCIARELEDERLIAHSLCNLGGALVQIGRYDEARSCYAEGGPIAERLGWIDSIALFEAGVGGLRAATGDIDGGLACYERSIAHFKDKGDLFQAARQKLLVSRHLFRAGRLDDARALLLRAEELCGDDTSRSTSWKVQDVLAAVLEQLGDLRGALAALRRSVARRETLLEQRAADRSRLLEFHLVAERATREAADAHRRSAQLQEALERQNVHQQEIERLARTDALTGLPNRRHMMAVAEDTLVRAGSAGRTVSLVLLDLDHFKRVNDELGHAAGDDVLVEVGRRLAGALRGGDTIARWGGEEFCLLLPDAGLDAAHAVVARLLERLRATAVPTREGPLVVTASAGVAELGLGESGIDALLHRADVALYEAKRAGRDRVMRAPPSSHTLVGSMRTTPDDATTPL